MRKLLKIMGMAAIYAFIMSIGMVVVFIPASHVFTIFFKTFYPPPSVLDWVKIGISVFLPINFILNMFVYLQRRFKAWCSDLEASQTQDSNNTEDI